MCRSLLTNLGRNCRPISTPQARPASTLVVISDISNFLDSVCCCKKMGVNLRRAGFLTGPEMRYWLAGFGFHNRTETSRRDGYTLSQPAGFHATLKKTFLGSKKTKAACDCPISSELLPGELVFLEGSRCIFYSKVVPIFYTGGVCFLLWVFCRSGFFFNI